MKTVKTLLHSNKQWAQSIKEQTPGFFKKLQKQQRPKYLWIGCSDSRVPANQITGLMPGEIFVHRNVSNQVINTDMNLLCVLQYAIETLKIREIIVCGHYGCGGVEAILQKRARGLLRHWLENVERLRREECPQNANHLCELNVLEQVKNVNSNPYVISARNAGMKIKVHGWIYSISNGIIKELI